MTNLRKYKSMISLVRNSVPAYLRRSEFYCCLSDNDDGAFSVPADVCKMEETVTRREDVTHLLRTVEYWGVYVIPDGILSLCTNTVSFDWSDTFTPFKGNLKYLDVVENLSRLPEEHKLAYAVKHEWFEIVEHLYCQNVKVPKNICELAASSGHVANLSYLCSRGFSTPQSCFALAAEAGSLSCLQFLCEQGLRLNSEAVCYAAARRGHVDCLTFALQHGRANYDTCSIAAAGGHLPCLILLYEHNCCGNASSCYAAAGAGHLNCLKFLHEHHCQWDQLVFAGAARNNHMDCFAYAHENGCPWNEFVTKQCAELGKLAFLQYAHQHGCPWSDKTTTAAAYHGHLHILQYLHAQGCPVGEYSCSNAACRGHLDCLRFFIEHDARRSISACPSAAASVPCLQLLRDAGFPWDSLTTIAAVKAGALESLIYATENGCPWWSRERPGQCVCSTAKEYYRSVPAAVLEYIESKQCPCPKRMNKEGVEVSACLR